MPRHKAEKANDSEAILSVHSPQLIVHHHGVGLLQSHEASLLGQGKRNLHYIQLSALTFTEKREQA